MLNQKVGKIPYMTGLDGLRSFAVVAVILYHLNVPFAMGGFLGVTVFFVLSGYLITNLLLYEWNEKQNIDLGNFWLRRAKRLLPAIFFLLIALNVFIPLIKPDLVSHLLKESFAALFYYSNWYYIFRDISYFESFEMTSLLTHFWSLAIEEQYYIIWALLLSFLLKKGVKNKLLFYFVFGSALLSAIWMGVLYQPNEDPSRIYYGTDTRLFSLLFGSSFAILLPSYRLKENISKMTRLVIEILGFVSLFVLVYMIVTMNQYDPFVYLGGMVIVSFITGFIILSIAIPVPLTINKVLSIKPLRWLGVRSYGIYLWHFPVIQWFNSDVNTGDLSYGKIILEIALIFTLAAFSYEMVEKPIRNGTFQIPFQQMGKVFLIGFLLLVVLKDFSPQTLAIHNNPKIEATKISGNLNQKELNTEVETKKEKYTVNEEKITAIGDSILVNPTPHLKEMFPNIYIDAKIGRQMWDVVPILQNLKERNLLNKKVILALGSNGVPTEDYFDEIMKTIGSERTVYFINTRVSKPWGNEVNKLLVRKSKEFKNMRIIDWYSASANHNEYFLSDGIHTNETVGAQIYAELIFNSIKNNK